MRLSTARNSEQVSPRCSTQIYHRRNQPDYSLHPVTQGSNTRPANTLRATSETYFGDRKFTNNYKASLDGRVECTGVGDEGGRGTCPPPLKFGEIFFGQLL